jgi:hypothetical protein
MEEQNFTDKIKPKKYLSISLADASFLREDKKPVINTH